MSKVDVTKDVTAVNRHHRRPKERNVRGVEFTGLTHSSGLPKHEQFRAVATRYDGACILAATIDVASIRIWLRDPVP